MDVSNRIQISRSCARAFVTFSSTVLRVLAVLKIQIRKKTAKQEMVWMKNVQVSTSKNYASTKEYFYDTT